MLDKNYILQNLHNVEFTLNYKIIEHCDSKQIVQAGGWKEENDCQEAWENLLGLQKYSIV